MATSVDFPSDTSLSSKSTGWSETSSFSCLDAAGAEIFLLAVVVLFLFLPTSLIFLPIAFCMCFHSLSSRTSSKKSSLIFMPARRAHSRFRRIFISAGVSTHVHSRDQHAHF